MTTQEKLAGLKTREQNLRFALAAELQSLAEQCARASRKIQNREYEDGYTGIAIDTMREAEDALVDALFEIRTAEWELLEEEEGNAA